MANPGVGPKFLSVNLSKSYGQSGRSSSSNGSYGSGRGRASGYVGGGGSGMVVLSRPRSSHKAGPKLSVPPPVNLPSLRKEHEKYDPLGSGSGSAGGVGPVNGSRPMSSGMGWSKPNAVTPAERDGISSARPLSSENRDHEQKPVVGSAKEATSIYTPPSVKLGTTGPISVPLEAEKATVLRGEDFPSLRATLSTTNGPSHKQKSGLPQNQKQAMIEESTSGQRDGSRSSSHIVMRPHGQSFQSSADNDVSVNGSDKRGSSAFLLSEQTRKQDDYFPGLLPLVRLSPRSDWADDERDTSHGFSERSKDNGFSQTEPYWDRDFDLPRSAILPYKPAQNLVNRWTRHDDDMSKALPTEIPTADLSSRNVRASSGEGYEGNSWRLSISKDALDSQEASYRNLTRARPTNPRLEIVKENKNMPSQFGAPVKEDYNAGMTAGRDSAFERRNVDYGLGGRQHQQWDKCVELSNGRGIERNIRDLYGSGPEINRYKVDSFESSLVSKTSYSTGKGFSGSDSLNFGREKRSISRREKPHVEDWGNAGFDEPDPFAGALLGVVKKKKDTTKHTDFHDPVRESFEAELERVQKLQEQERQRIIEEQERTLEMARREEEERQRIAREKEEQQRKMEEEAREAAWRAEQERFEAMRRAEEQRLAREEEKRRIFMEEERRKQAAKQKLEELEERIARRTETANAGGSVAMDESMGGVHRERDASGTDDLVGWKGSERMAKVIPNSASCDSSSLSKPFDVGLKTHSLRDGSFAFTDRGKPNSWRRDIFDNGSSSAFSPPEQENSHQSPRRDAFASGRTSPHNDVYGGNGQIGSRGYYRGGFPEPQVDDFSHAKAHKWNISADGGPYSRNKEFNSEFQDTIADRFSEMGWNQDLARGNLHASDTDQVYQTSELDELYSYGRPRYSSRQPRVLPPPSLASMHKKSFRSDVEHAGPSLHEDNNIQYAHTSSDELTASSYHNDKQEMQGHPDVLVAQEESSKTEVQNLNRDSTLRCDSQSSLSVSSPPHSPVHLSHDDLDDTGDSPMASAPTENNGISLSGNDPAVLNIEIGKENMMTTSSSISTGDGDWGIENNEDLPEQEVYEEDDDGFIEEDEVHERPDENVVLAEEFEGMPLEAADPSHEMDNVVLGFDQGVQVCIPSDECDRSPREKESSYAVPQVSCSTVQQSDTLKSRQGDGLSVQFGDGSSHMVVNSPSREVNETQSTLQNFVSQPISATHTSTSTDLLNPTYVSSGSALSAHQSGPCVDMNSFSSGPAVASSTAYPQNQADMPVKLQFGLFSGPSLIPSPIPAIQIGSIQMPLQLHPQVGPSITHMHPPQPPLFQLGQLRYPSPVSLGLLPMTPQSMTFSQPNVPTNYPLNQKTGVAISGQLAQDGPSHSFLKDDALSLPRDSQHSDAPVSSAPKVILCKEVNVVKERERAESDVALLHQIRAEESNACENQSRVKLSCQNESDGSQHNSVRNSTLTSIFGASEGQLSSKSSSAHGFTSAKCVSDSTSQAQSKDSRGRRLAFAPRNPIQKLPFPAVDSSCSDINGFQRRPRRGFQRMEFRVRQSADRRQSSGSFFSNHAGTYLKSNNSRKGSRTSARSGFKKEPLLGRPRQMTESGDFGSDQVDIQGTNYEIEADGRKKIDGAVGASHLGEGRQKRNISSGDDVDAPLQSGIVRIFNQPGIEAPSDEDDFIEVRSKRQMLNDRREQREREIKAKSNSKKALRKPRPASQGAAVARTAVRVATSSSLEASNGTDADITRKRGLLNDKVAPIGTPINAEAPDDVKSHNNKSVEASSLAAASSAGQTVEPGFIFESKEQVLDNAKGSLGSWGVARINQEVMPLTQTQFDEAMKSTCLDTHSSSTVNHAKSVSKPSISSSPIILKDTPFSSVQSPINSLLAGEKIQFGAVTSPTVLPSSRAVSHGIGPPGSHSNISQNATLAENSCSVLFEKDKNTEESCINLEAAEAEAEAAASAVAVAAISNDEGVGNGLDSCPVSIPEVSGTGDHQLISESKGEETLTVSLPADLSVETPPISLWPPLPSPHTSSGQMLSPFPGGTRSNFPLYDMNPVLGGPVFAFGPQEESAGSQSQPQNSTSASGPARSWQQCPSGVDSFYGPPTGFTGPFINPPGGIPGVQGPPHMVVYNHFAPIGHFGQVGLSYMGTYISSTKQPDWKHNPTAAGCVGVAEGDVKNFNMASAPHNPANVQNLAPGSPLLPMPPPLAMFDVSPFQSADVSVQGRWPHVPAPPSIHSIPQSMPLSQQSEGALPSHLSHGPVDNHSLAIGRFSKPQAPSPPESGNALATAATDATVTDFVDKLGLLNPHGSEASVRAASNESFGNKSAVLASGKADANKSNVQGTSSGPILHALQQKNSSGQQQYIQQPSYNYQRAGAGESQKNGPGAEWSHRRMGFHRRNQPSGGGDRGYPPTKMKQIYVAKQSSGGASSAV